ncbi:MAG TPA: hypothetical protein VII87_03595 [Solirubrobacteraceae bacterium]|jgi:hypothetical protein
MNGLRVTGLVAIMVALGGCGSSAATGPGPPSAAANAAARRLLAPGLHSLPAPGPTGRAADPAAVKVIRGWSDALRSGHVRTAGRYFSLPSELVNGSPGGAGLALTPIATLHQAVAANELLPCGAKLISTDQRGRYVNALFRLTGRSGPGGDSCGGGAGQTARTNFLIVDGRIVEWIRAPDDPGDNGGPSGSGNGTTGPLV